MRSGGEREGENKGNDPPNKNGRAENPVRIILTDVPQGRADRNQYEIADTADKKRLWWLKPNRHEKKDDPGRKNKHGKTDYRVKPAHQEPSRIADRNCNSVHH